MIRSFADRETREVYEGRWPRRLPQEVARAANRRLIALDAALTVEDLRNPPGNQLEALRGRRKGQWSIRVNARWRICFAWTEEGAADVELVDYHDE